MKMQVIGPYSTTRSLMIMSLIVYILVSTISLVGIDGQSKKDYNDGPPHKENNDVSHADPKDKKSDNAIGIRGDQLIYCEGDLSSCHNVLTNIICSNVKYCIVGDVTPFVMSNPL